MALILKRISDETRNATLRESCKEALDYLGSETNHAYGLGSFWMPFKLACHAALPPSVREAALDGIQRLLAHGLLNGSTLILPDGSPDTKIPLIDEIVSIVCSCFTFTPTEHPVQLQVLKVLLTLISCTHCHVASPSLLKIVETCFGIHVNSKSVVNQVTAKASLTQITNVVYQKVQQSFATRRESDVGDLEVSPVMQEGMVSIVEEVSGDVKDTVSEVAINPEAIDNAKETAVNDNAKESTADDSVPPTDLASTNSLPNLEELSSYQQARKNAMQMFRLLCRVSNQTDHTKQPQSDGLTEPISSLPVDEMSATTLKARLLALDMILSIFNNAGPMFLDDELTLKIIKRYLCASLSRNGISSHAGLFEVSLSIFLLVVRYFRANLKVEVGILLNTFLHILEMHTATFVQKGLVLQALLKISSNPQILSDLFINYDCDINSVSLFEKSVMICCKLAQTKVILPETNQSAIYNIASQAIGFENKNETARQQEKRIRVNSLACLFAILKSMVVWSTHRTFQDRTRVGERVVDEQVTVVSGKNPLNGLVIAQSEHARAMTDSIPTTVNVRENTVEDDLLLTGLAGRKQIMSQTVVLFDTEPNRAIKRLIEVGLLDKTPEAVAEFLIGTSGLSKTAIGEYIGHGDAFNKRCMHAFIDRLNLNTKGFVEALRFMLQTFRLPGEAQKIDRLMEKFADSYCESNPGIFSKADTAYTLAFSVIMLNTDQHSTQIKHRMDKAAFIKNNTGINDNGDLPEAYLGLIFDEISTNEIIMNTEHTNQSPNQIKEFEMNEDRKREMYSIEVAQMQKKSSQLMRSAVHSPFTSATQKELAKPMFTLVSWPMMAVFSLIFEAAIEESDTQADAHHICDPQIVQYCLEGFEHGIYLACTFSLDTERDAYLTSLSNLTGFSRISNLKMKNVRAMRSIIGIATTLGDHLDSAWIHIIKTLSQIDKLTTALHGNVEEDSSGDEKRYSGYMIQVFGLISNTGSDAVITAVTDEGFGLLSDKVFNQSVGLSSEGVLWLFRAMCQVSLEEVGLVSEGGDGTKKAKVHFEDANLSSSRIYTLQKIVEVSYYNMTRIRLEWMSIWKILQKHFNAVGCHDNALVSTFTIDSMRQLCVKFLEKDELANYNTQSQFLRSFEWIMKRTRSSATKALIIDAISQMIVSKSTYIRSGWCSILATLSNINDTVESVREKSFALVKVIHASHFDLVLSTGAFNGFITCLLEFCLLPEGSPVQNELILEAFDMIQHCSRLIVTHKTINSRPSSRRGSFVSRESMLESSTSEVPPDIKSDDVYYLKWFPIFSAFSKIAIDADSEQGQTRGLEALFETLGDTSHYFDCGHWKSIFKSIVNPLFENLEDGSSRTSVASRRSLSDRPSILIHGLSLLVNLFNKIFSSITTLAGGDEVFQIVIDTILSMYQRSDDRFATSAGICFNKLLERNIDYIVESNPKYLEIATGALEKAFDLTVPAELLNCVYPIRGASLESLEASTRADDTAVLSPLSISFSNEVLPSISTLAVLSFVSQKGRDIAARVCIDRFTLDTLDFNQVILKCGMHLEFIDSLRNLLFSQVESQAINEESLVEATSPLIVMIQPEFRTRWLYLIYSSYCIARSFNANYDLRQSIWKKGLIKQLPNLVRQETQACTLYIEVLFTLHKHDPANTDILHELIKETIDVLQRLDDLLQDQAKNARDIGVWVQVVVMIFRELVAFEGVWKDDARFMGLRGSLERYVRLCVRMIVVESADVRIVLRMFLEKAHSIMVIGF